MNSFHRHFALLAGLWLLLVLVEVFSHSFIPIDETRYVTVAWNMWLNGDYLVPYLNGVAYSHKPPLLFWLMNLGWGIFGVNDWWPRVVPALFAFGSIWLTLRLALRLWPEERHIHRVAPLVLLGTTLWTGFMTATMFDMLVAFFTTLGAFGLLIVWQERSIRGWLLFGLAIGGGLLAKGPTIFLQLLPLALIAPWWGRGEDRRWKAWYAGIALSVLLGIAIALAWAIPAGIRGGAAYQHAIFWGQTADRMVESFAHRRKWWWYASLLPLLFFPWILWLPIWRSMSHFRTLIGEPGVRFCLAWLLPVFIAFSLISGKQVHYLLPIYPAFALLVARLLLQAPEKEKREGVLVMLVTLGAGLVLLYLPSYAHSHALAAWLQHLPVWGGLALIVGSVGIWLSGSRPLLIRVWALALLSVLLATLLNLYFIRSAGTAYDVRPIGSRLKLLEEQGVPLAHVGNYPGTFNFVGRLKRSPEILARNQVTRWFAKHPAGRAIVYFDSRHPLGDIRPEFIQDYRGRQVGIVDRRQWQSLCETGRTPC